MASYVYHNFFFSCYRTYKLYTPLYPILFGHHQIFLSEISLLCCPHRWKLTCPDHTHIKCHFSAGSIWTNFSKKLHICWCIICLNFEVLFESESTGIHAHRKTELLICLISISGTYKRSLRRLLRTPALQHISWEQLIDTSFLSLRLRFEFNFIPPYKNDIIKFYTQLLKNKRDHEENVKNAFSVLS